MIDPDSVAANIFILMTSFDFVSCYNNPFLYRPVLKIYQSISSQCCCRQAGLEVEKLAILQPTTYDLAFNKSYAANQRNKLLFLWYIEEVHRRPIYNLPNQLKSIRLQV